MHRTDRTRPTSSLLAGHSLAGLLAATAVLAIATAASAQIKSWNTTSGNWGVAGNWSPFGIPGVGDQVFIGDLPGIQLSTISVNVNTTIASLAITDGTKVATTGGQLVVTGPTTISGEFEIEPGLVSLSALRIVDGPAPIDAILGDVTASGRGSLALQGGVVQINGLLTANPDSFPMVTHNGAPSTINLTSNAPIAMLVNRSIDVGVGGPLTINQLGAGRIDLGGSLGGTNLSLSGAGPNGYTRLTINAPGLFDAMDGDITMSRGSELTMNLTEGWTLADSAKITINGTILGPADPPTLIVGDTLTLEGDLFLNFPSSWLWLNAPLVFVPGADIQLVNGARLELNSGATLLGGSIQTANTTFDGSVKLFGTTTFDGTMALGGSVRQNGHAIVAGPTAISAGRFDMDGESENAMWTINDATTINALAIDEFDNVFDGTMTISGPSSARLTLHLDNPTASWSLGAAPAKMTLASSGPMTTRLDGSPFRMFGELEVTNAVRIAANTRLEQGSVVSFTTPNSRLRLAGESLVTGAAFLGGGRLENQFGATLRMAQGTSLGSTDLLNEGTLRLGGAVGTGPGVAFMNNALFDLGSVFVIEIGGAVSAFEHDQLQLFGPQSVLAGVLDVRLINLGNGVFLPSIGESFTIVQAPVGTISGAFEDGPVSSAPNATYIWSVGQSSNRFNDMVTITVAEIIPCPGDLNGDGMVDGADLGLMLSAWGACSECLADLNDDGVVDGADLGILLSAWGACPLG